MPAGITMRCHIVVLSNPVRDLPWGFFITPSLRMQTCLLARELYQEAIIICWLVGASCIRQYRRGGQAVFLGCIQLINQSLSLDSIQFPPLWWL